MNERNTEVGTNGGLSQRWREVYTTDILAEQSNAANRSRELCADDLEAAKLRLEQDLTNRITAEEKVLAQGLSSYMVPYHEGEKAAYEAVLKIIREIL